MSLFNTIALKVMAHTRKEVVSLKENVTDWIVSFNKRNIELENKVKELEERLVRLEGKTVMKYFDANPLKRFDDVRRR